MKTTEADVSFQQTVAAHLFQCISGDFFLSYYYSVSLSDVLLPGIERQLQMYAGVPACQNLGSFAAERSAIRSASAFFDLTVVTIQLHRTRKLQDHF